MNTFLSKKHIVDILKSLSDHIKKEYKAEIIGIFGSYARNEQTEHSDIDILVRFSEDATLFDFNGLANFIEEQLGIRVDIVSLNALREEFKDSVLKEIVRV